MPALRPPFIHTEHEQPPPATLLEALNASDVAIAISDTERRLSYVNDGFVRMFGWDRAELLGRYVHEVLMGPHSDPALVQHIREGLDAHHSVQREALLYTRAGEPRWVSIRINPWEPPTQHTGGSVTVLTELSAPMLHERLQQRVLEAVVQEQSLPELMRLICAEVERIAPEVTATVLSVDAQQRVHPLAAPGLPADIGAALDGLPIGPKAGSCGTAAYTGRDVVVTDIATDPLWDDYRAVFMPTGLRACWSNPIKDHGGRVVGAFAFYYRTPRAPSTLHRKLVEVCLHLCTLAFERDTNRQRLHQLAYFDSLTGLPNRVMFCETAEQRLRELQAAGEPAALMFIDLDRFKQVNDTQGHAAGDLLLQEIARRLSAQRRTGDLVARLASDEFVLLLTQCTADAALNAAQQVLDRIAEPLDIFGQTQVPGAGIGLAMFPTDGQDVDTLMRHADQAMGYARAERRHSAALFSADMNLRAQESMALERALREAIEQRQLTLHYQPQVRMGSSLQLYGVEALTRWHHPQRGHIPPSRFIPIAEESGLIHELTLWLIDEASRQLRAWRDAGYAVPCVAVNISGRSFHQPDLTTQVMQRLTAHGLGPEDLLLEITESVMMDARPVTMANIEQLHAQGLRLSLDDFGTGYSSLSYLHRLPFAELKLDQSFVKGVTHSRTAQALTTSILSIAHSLRMTVVAEGVETAEQRDWLRSHGCEVMQGYLLARPLPARELQAWCDSQRAPNTQPAAA